jgi:hypothetical protein
MLVTAGAGIVSAHAPLAVSPREGIAGATVIGSPEKSYVIYTKLDDDGDAQYYRFSLQKGQVLYGSLQVPGPDSAVPDLVVIGPGIGSSGSIPSAIEVPDGSGALLVPKTRPQKPSYEPFTPQPIYEAARYNVTAPETGDYYLAVAGAGGAHYSLAPGFREEFTAAEWLLIPWSVLFIHFWEGQSPAVVFAPGVLVAAGGLFLAVLYRRKLGVRREPLGWLILLAGLLYLGGAAMTGFQMIHALLRTGYSAGVLLTLFFIAGPVVLGLFAVRAGVRSSGTDPSLMSGFAMAVIGILGLLLWAGLLIGPVLALAGSAAVLVRSAIKPGSS